MELGLSGRTAAVAAASAGLGLAAAAALAAEGARVAICGRDADRLRQAAARIGAVPVAADVSSTGGATEFVERATAALGGLDILVTNAGGPPAGTFDTTDLAGYEEAVSTNLLSVVAMCQAAVPGMRRTGWGRVVHISSISVKQPLANLILSNTARAGAAGFLKTLAIEVAGAGITVNSLLPAFHDTDRVRRLHGDDLGRLGAQLPAGRIGAPEEFGAFVAFLCSEQAGFVTGTAIPVDGGFHAGLL